MWVRWAVRRLGPFAYGRPGTLLEAIRSDEWRSGMLGERLRAANLPQLELRHQRALGVPVGQRVMGGTFVVRCDGLDPCLDSDALDPWTSAYRQGLATGLTEDKDGRLTLTPHSVRWAAEVIDPIPDNAEWLAELVERVGSHPAQAALQGDAPEMRATREGMDSRASLRPQPEREAWAALAHLLYPPGTA